jgi:hypothetical protein
VQTFLSPGLVRGPVERVRGGSREVARNVQSAGYVRVRAVPGGLFTNPIVAFPFPMSRDNAC